MGTKQCLTLVQISFVTFLLAGLLQVLNNKSREFKLDCDEKIELIKLKLKLDDRKDKPASEKAAFSITEAAVDTER